MGIKVYTISGAPRPWRILLGLAFKGLDWDTHVLQVSTREHKSPEFLKLNPRGTVPVLEADGVLLRDSIAILAWLDRRYPARPLFGETPNEAALVWQIAMECCDYLRAAANAVLFPVLVRNESPAPGGKAEAALKEAGEVLHTECRYLEQLLESSPFLAGETPSAADAVSFPEIRLVQRAVETKHDVMASLGFANPSTLYPNVAAWKDRISALPKVDETLPPHWRQ